VEPTAEVSSKDFQIALTPGRILGLQIFQAALGAGVVILVAVVVFYFPSHAPRSLHSPPYEEIESARLLSLANLALVTFCWLLSTGLYYFLLRAARREMSARAPAERCFFRIRRAIILGLLPVGAAAVFGLVVLVFTSDVRWAISRFWLNAIPAVIFLLHVIFTFPTRASLELIFEGKVAGPYRFEPGDQLVVRFVREGVVTVVTASPEKAKNIYEHLCRADRIAGDQDAIVARASFERNGRERLSFKFTRSGAIVMDGEIYAGTEEFEALARQATGY